MRIQYRGLRLARMSSGTFCLVRDLGLVKGGKGLKCFEPVVTFSFRAARLRVAASAVFLLKAGFEALRAGVARLQQRRMQDAK